MKLKSFPIFLLIFVIILAGGVMAKDAPGADKVAKTRSTTGGAGIPTFGMININNWLYWLESNGRAGYDPFHGGNGGIFPRGTSAVIFQDGFVFGGPLIDTRTNQPPATEKIRVGGQTYNQGMVAGAIKADGTAEDANAPDVRLYRIRRNFNDPNEDLTPDAADFFQKSQAAVSTADINALKAQYSKDWAEWPVAKGAPYIDRNKNGKYDPPPAGNSAADLIAKSLDEPGIAGADVNAPADQVMWTACNDLNDAASRSLYGSPPTGVELQITVWGYKATNALGNVLFKKFRLTNRGFFRSDSFFVSQWCDPDLGDFGDDYAGCDTSIVGGKSVSLGYVYNSNTVDREFRKFNIAPPAGGFDFFQGPIVPGAATDQAIFDLKRVAGKKNLPMTAFNYFSAGSPISDPPQRVYEGTLRWWKILRGFIADESARADRRFTDNRGNLTSFALAGDPVAKTGWIDGTAPAFPPGDRRIILASGPFSFKPNDVQEVVVGIVAGLGADKLSSISVMKFSDRFAQNTYDALFAVPVPPKAPTVTARELDGEIVLEWGSSLTSVGDTEVPVNGTYAFEGYNVYQFPSITSTLADGKRLANYDVINEVTVVLDDQFDPSSGQILRLPVQLGSNNGIVRNFRINSDAVTGKSKLSNGLAYYFGVTAYSVSTDPGATPIALESSPRIITVIPQSNKPGVRYNDQSGAEVTVRHSAGLSDVASLPISVVDPGRVVTGDYRISISKDAQGVLRWTLRNTTAAQDVLSSKAFGSADTGDPNDDFNFPIANGLLLKVQQISPAILDDSTKFTQPSGIWLRSGRFSGAPAAPAGAEFMTTGEDLGNAYLGQFHSTWDARDNYPVIVRFGPNNKQKAYRLRRTGAGTEYKIQDTNPTPEINVTAFDVRNPAAPRQLTISWRDQDNNATWNPTEASDGVEILFIHDRAYDPTMAQYDHLGNGKPAINNECTNSTKSDVIYGISCRLAVGATLNQSDITMRIRPALRLNAGDVYSFTLGGVTTSADVAKADVDKINVFPNPYYAFNAAETNRFVRFVTFNFLPAKATVRIFNVAGQLVRVLEKNDDSQFLRWDLSNANNFPVASGMYIIHIDMPEVGATKILKAAVLVEKEVLEVF